MLAALDQWDFYLRMAQMAMKKCRVIVAFVFLLGLSLAENVEGQDIVPKAPYPADFWSRLQFSGLAEGV